MFDLSDLPIADVHCHPFISREVMTTDEFVNVTAFGGGSTQYLEEANIPVDSTQLDQLQRAKRDVIYFRHMTHRLAELFACEPDIDQIIVHRNQTIAQEGYAHYTRRLFESAGLRRLFVDFGYPQPAVEVPAFKHLAGIEVVPIFRIEVLIAELLQSDVGWSAFKRRYDDTISTALTSGGYRGLKSIIAYRTGLDISPLSRTPDQGLQALDAIRRGTGGDAMKKLRDYLFCRALELSIEHDVPMQVHTGMGDWQVQLPTCRPALLMDLLRFPTFRACRVLLVHTGYPYHTEAGYMANVLPNLWCDLSEGIPFAGNAAKRIISEVLEMAPVSRICYGSDAYGAPEPFFASAKLGKQALTQTLQELMADHMLSAAEAQQVARQVLFENACQLYQLPM
jgi:hypothetical protein